MANRVVKIIVPRQIDGGATANYILVSDTVGSGSKWVSQISESQVTNLTTDLAAKVAKAGDTMTGALTIDVASGTIQTWKIASVVQMVLDTSGKLVVGTDPGGSEKLRVGGSVKASGAITSTSTAAGAVTSYGDIYLLKAANTDAQFLIQVTALGSIQFGLNNSGSTNVAGCPTGGMYVGSNGSFPLYLTSGGVVGLKMDTNRDVIIGTDPTGSEKLRVGGGIRATGAHSTFKWDQNGVSRVYIANTDTGSSAACSFTFENDTYPTGGAFFFYTSSSYSGYGGPNSFNLVALGTNPMAFGTNNTIYGKLNGDGTWVFGSDPGGSEKVRVGGDIKATNATLSGAINQTGGQYHYLRGDASTDGSVRFSSPSSGVMTIESRISGTWTEIGRFG